MKQLYIAVSLDGYIADKDGGVGFLNRFHGGDSSGYDEFFSQVGAIVSGATTYAQLLEWGVDWPYGDTPAWVFTHRSELDVPEGATVHFTDKPIAEVVPEIEREVDGNIWVLGGGKLVKQFVDAGLVDQLILFVVPELLGEGVRLFPGTAPARAELIDAKPFESGLVRLRYGLISSTTS